MSAPRLLLVQADDESPPGGLEAPFRIRGAALVLWRPHTGDAVPEGPFDGIVALGGRPDPDGETWLDAVRAVLDEALKRGTPILGVCLGAQLLAQVAGGRTAEGDGSAEVGWVTLAVDDALATDDPVLRALTSGQRVFSWHSADIDPPESACVIARSRAAVQAFRIGECAWGVQFHVEIEPGIAAMWSVKGADQLGPEQADPEDLRAETALRASRTQAFADELAARFLSVCARTAATTR